MAKLPKPKSKLVDYDDDDSYMDEPQPRTSIPNLVLCVLNLLAVGAFAYFLVLDLQNRQAWSYSVFLHDLAILGLPLQEEDDKLTASRETAQKTNLRSEALQDAYQKRKTGVPARETFIAPEHPIPVRILPRHLNDEILKDHFGDSTPLVKTLEEEVERLKSSILDDIAKAGQDTAAAAKTPEEKRQKLEKVLLPLAANVFHARELDRIIRTAKDDKLDELLIEAVQKQLLLDILQPIETSRPGDVQKYLEKQEGERDEDRLKILQDPPQLKLEMLQAKLTARLENAISPIYKSEVFQGKEWEGKPRDTIEKRQNIALLLFAIGHVLKPDGSPLYDQGAERAELVVGVREFSQAARAYEDAVKALGQRMIQLVKDDRDGVQVQIGDKIVFVPGFKDNYPEVIQRIRELLRRVNHAEKRLESLVDQSAQARKTYEDRLKHLEEVKSKLVSEREKTAKILAELRVRQARLFGAQLELADAAEVNFRLEIELRRKEQELKVLLGPAP